MVSPQQKISDLHLSFGSSLKSRLGFGEAVEEKIAGIESSV
jgi:hypothetical protein